MAFTYDLTTNAGHIRLNIGDTVENTGPRPDKRNFSDAEIAFMYSEEGHVVSATAYAFEILAGEWQSYSLREKEDTNEFDAKELADKYWNLANMWRRKPNGGDSSGSLQAGVISLDFMQKDYDA